MNNMERINTKEGSQSTIHCSKCYVTSILFNCQRSIYNSIDFYLYFCCDKDHDNKEFSREN